MIPDEAVEADRKARRSLWAAGVLSALPVTLGVAGLVGLICNRPVVPWPLALVGIAVAVLSVMAFRAARRWQDLT